MKMRLALAALLLTSTSAFAADLAPQAVEPVAPVVAPVYNWTGFYAGVHAGAAIGQGKVGSVKLNGTGFLGGVHAGYNSQFDGGFVVGLDLYVDLLSDQADRGGHAAQLGEVEAHDAVPGRGRDIVVASAGAGLVVFLADFPFHLLPGPDLPVPDDTLLFQGVEL